MKALSSTEGSHVFPITVNRRPKQVYTKFHALRIVTEAGRRSALVGRLGTGINEA